MSDAREDINILQSYAASMKGSSDKMVELASRLTELTDNLTPNKMKRREEIEKITDELNAMEANMAMLMKSIEYSRDRLPEKKAPPEAGPSVRSRSLTPMTRNLDFREKDDKQEEQFADFLATIGDAVVKSQEALDERSVNYLQRNRDRPFIPPTLFRIPKISAALKVGLQKSSEKGLSVVVASSKRRMDELNEQNINFEIAAVPPTPELLKMLDDKAPRIDFLFSEAGRKEVFKELKPFSREEAYPARLKEQLLRMIHPDNQSKVIIWPLRDSGQSFILLFAGENSEEDVGVWYYDRSPRKLISIIRADLQSKINEDQNPLRKFVLQLGQSQAELLDS